MSFGALSVDLTDFVLLALLQLVMYLLTIVELGLGQGRESATASVDRSKAATWAFVGVFLTLIAGGVAKSAGSPIADDTAFAIAVFVIGRWGFYHWRISKLLDSSAIESELSDVYRRALNRVFEESDGKGLSSDDVAVRMLPQLRMIHLASNSRFFRQLFPVSLNTVFERFLPTPANLRPLLEELVSAGTVRQDGEKYCLVRATVG